MEYKKQDSENQSQMVNEPSLDYGITIPIIVPTTGNYTLEELTHKLTEFAKQLVSQKSKPNDWRNIIISNEVKKMSLGESQLSKDSRSHKDLLTDNLKEKYK